MPTYEYQCDACGHEFERVQRITEDPLKTCPQCKKRKVQRLISQTSFVLKGSGWYNDLYSSKKADAKDQAADKGGKSEADSSPDTDKPSKKDSKKDSKKSSEKKSSSGGGKKSKGSQAAA